MVHVDVVGVHQIGPVLRACHDLLRHLGPGGCSAIEQTAIVIASSWVDLAVQEVTEKGAEKELIRVAGVLEILAGAQDTGLDELVRLPGLELSDPEC